VWVKVALFISLSLSATLTHLLSNGLCGRAWRREEIRLAQLSEGVENADTINARKKWTFEQSQGGDEGRARCAEQLWSTLHIDLRMVDTSGSIIRQ
jgi:hypothetical protein